MNTKILVTLCAVLMPALAFAAPPAVTRAKPAVAAKIKQIVNKADTGGKVVLETWQRSAPGGHLNADDSQPFNGTILVDSSLKNVGFGFKSTQSDSIGGVPKNAWTQVKATKAADQTNVPAGKTRMAFTLTSNTYAPGSMASPRAFDLLTLSGLPFATAKGTTLWDHNYAPNDNPGNPDGNYALNYRLNGLDFKR